jgi:hypothetical protein
VQFDSPFTKNALSRFDLWWEPRGRGRFATLYDLGEVPMANNRASSSGGVLGFLMREGTALIFAAFVWFAIWGGYHPRMETTEQAFTHALVAGLIALGYLGLQALAVVTAPLARETRYLLDLVLSLVPLALIGYATMQAFTGQLTLTLFQKGVLCLGGTACMIDVTLHLVQHEAEQAGVRFRAHALRCAE